eukprot:1152685-Pelagomonas_calceolata.AAC.5
MQVGLSTCEPNYDLFLRPNKINYSTSSRPNASDLEHAWVMWRNAIQKQLLIESKVSNMEHAWVIKKGVGASMFESHDALSQARQKHIPMRFRMGYMSSSWCPWQPFGASQGTGYNDRTLLFKHVIMSTRSFAQLQVEAPATGFEHGLLEPVYQTQPLQSCEAAGQYHCFILSASLTGPLACDKAPAALNDLDVLMEETYQALSSTSSEMEAAQGQLLLLVCASVMQQALNSAPHVAGRHKEKLSLGKALFCAFINTQDAPGVNAAAAGSQKVLRGAAGFLTEAGLCGPVDTAPHTVS